MGTHLIVSLFELRVWTSELTLTWWCGWGGLVRRREDHVCAASCVKYFINVI